VAEPLTFDRRLQGVRNRRMASRLSDATSAALWIAGLTGLLGIVGAGLLNFH
jgi:hypothetical protein